MSKPSKPNSSKAPPRLGSESVEVLPDGRRVVWAHAGDGLIFGCTTRRSVMDSEHIDLARTQQREKQRESEEAVVRALRDALGNLMPPTTSLIPDGQQRDVTASTKEVHQGKPLTIPEALTLWVIANAGDIPITSSQIGERLQSVDVSSGTGSVKRKFVPPLRRWLKVELGEDIVRSDKRRGYWIDVAHRQAAKSAAERFIPRDIVARIDRRDQ